MARKWAGTASKILGKADSPEMSNKLCFSVVWGAYSAYEEYWTNAGTEIAGKSNRLAINYI